MAKTLGISDRITLLGIIINLELKLGYYIPGGTIYNGIEA